MTDGGSALLDVDGVSKEYSTGSGLLAFLGRGSTVRAVDDVSFEVREGETFTVLGESGSGRSTLFRAITGGDSPTEGRVTFRGQEVTGSSDGGSPGDLQAIAEDPDSSFETGTTAGEYVTGANGTGRDRGEDLLETVGLDTADYDREVADLSAEEGRRVALARALSTDPSMVAWDEPTAGLDAPAQARILNLLRDLRAEFDLTYLLVTGDPGVARYVADRVAVMYLGEVVERAVTEELFENPAHPYTRALLDATAFLDPGAEHAGEPLFGDRPDPADPPSGCRFHTRCPEMVRPGAVDVDPSRFDDEVRESMLDSYRMTDREWENLLSLARAVDRDAIEIDIEPLVGDIVDEDQVLAKLDREYFDGGDARPRGEVGEVIEDLAYDLGNNNWEEARETVRQVFLEPSICTVERPDYDVEAEYGEDHFAACHHHHAETDRGTAHSNGQEADSSTGPGGEPSDQASATNGSDGGATTGE